MLLIAFSVLLLFLYSVLDLQPGAAGFQLSNPPVLQCMLLKASLNVFSQTSMAELTAKSRILTGYLELLIETFLSKKSRASENGWYGNTYRLRGVYLVFSPTTFALLLSLPSPPLPSPPTFKPFCYCIFGHVNCHEAQRKQCIHT